MSRRTEMDSSIEQPVLEPTITQRRRQTRNSVYQLIFNSREPMSKQQIGTALGLSLPTVHQNITELLDAGLIRAGEVQRSTGGRPPVGYEIEPDVRFSLGVAISANHVRLWAGNLLQEERAYQSMEVPYVAKEEISGDGSQLEEISGDRLHEQIRQFIDDSQLDPKKLLGIGITIPGIFDEETDQIVLSPTLKMKNFSLKKLVHSTDAPVKVFNDSSCAGIEELIERRRRGEKQDFVTLSLENGIGGSVFADGRQLEGTNKRSAEFGHMRIVPGGRMCNCGQKGCLEAYCSAFRLTRDLGLSMGEFFSSLEQEKGRGMATNLFQEWLHYLSIGIINLRMAFDCDIVLCGFVTEYLAPYLEELRQMVAQQDPFGEKADYLTLAGSPKASLQGAAWTFVENFVKEI